MSDDWNIGDLAVCVDPAGPLTMHRGYTVIGFAVASARRDGKVLEGLVLSGLAMPSGYVGCDPRRFRKIRPDAHEACEAEFVTLLKRSKVTETASAWLERAGPIARKMNQESQRDAGAANNRPATDK